MPAARRWCPSRSCSGRGRGCRSRWSLCSRPPPPDRDRRWWCRCRCRSCRWWWCRSWWCRSWWCRSWWCRSLSCRSWWCRSLWCRWWWCRSLSCRWWWCRSLSCRWWWCRSSSCPWGWSTCPWSKFRPWPDPSWWASWSSTSWRRSWWWPARPWWSSAESWSWRPSCRRSRPRSSWLHREDDLLGRALRQCDALEPGLLVVPDVAAVAGSRAAHSEDCASEADGQCDRADCLAAMNLRACLWGPFHRRPPVFYFEVGLHAMRGFSTQNVFRQMSDRT